MITDAQTWGTFAIFDTSNFEKIREERIEFKSPLIRMLVCKLSNRIFLVMKSYVSGLILLPESKDDRNKILKSKYFMKS